MAFLLTFDRVTVAEHGRPRLDDVSVGIEPGGITGVVGPRGSGRSTFLRCANGLVRPDAGTVLYRGRDVAELDGDRHRREVGLLFDRALPFSGSVRDNLRMAGGHLPDDDAGGLLDGVALGRDVLGRDATTLTDGEAQRLGVARALAAAGPDGLRVLLADEPTVRLGHAASRELERLLVELAGSGIDVVLACTDRDQADRLCDRTIELQRGRVVGATS